MEKKEKLQKQLELSLIIIIFIIIFFVIVNTPIIVKYKNTGNLIISEIMPINNNTIKSTDNLYHDYIEIYNGYNYSINLEGYYLSDDEFNTKKWNKLVIYY